MGERDDGFGGRWARRAVTLPATFALTAAATVILPAVLVVALVADALGRRRWALSRTALMLAGFLWCESLGLLAAGAIWLISGGGFGRGRRGFLDANARLQAVWGNTLLGIGTGLFGMRVVVEGEAPRPGGRPLLVFVRHASTADTVLPVALLSYPLGWRLRYVLKRELLVDPCLDVVGHRLPNVFVRRGGERTAEEVARVVALAEGMDGGDALVIFPEGTRYTPRKRAEVLARLAERGPSPSLDLAGELVATLSPLRQGPLALLARGGMDLLVIAHTGFEAAESLASFTRGTLIGGTLRIRLRRIRAEDIPGDAAGQARMLADLWREVDRFAAAPRLADAAPVGGVEVGEGR